MASDGKVYMTANRSCDSGANFTRLTFCHNYVHLEHVPEDRWEIIITTQPKRRPSEMYHFIYAAFLN